MMTEIMNESYTIKYVGEIYLFNVTRKQAPSPSFSDGTISNFPPLFSINASAIGKPNPTDPERVE
jgi:hypothetical protein